MVNKKQIDLVDLITKKFDEQDQRLTKKFDEQDKKLDSKFAEQDKKNNQGFGVLSKKIDQQFESQFIKWFNKGYEEVVAPALESLEQDLKLEMKSVRKEMNSGFNKVNAKIDAHDRRTDHLATQVGDHEKRIKKLESKRVVTA